MLQCELSNTHARLRTIFRSLRVGPSLRLVLESANSDFDGPVRIIHIRPSTRARVNVTLDRTADRYSGRDSGQRFPCDCSAMPPSKQTVLDSVVLIAYDRQCDASWKTYHSLNYRSGPACRREPSGSTSLRDFYPAQHGRAVRPLTATPICDCWTGLKGCSRRE